MSSRGSQLQRAVQFFRDGQIDEVEAAFTIVKRVVEGRLAEGKSKVKSQIAAASTPRKARRTKAQMAAARTPQVVNDPT